MNELNSLLSPHRVYKTQIINFTADTVGDQFAMHTEVRQSYGACQVHQLVKFQKTGALLIVFA